MLNKLVNVPSLDAKFTLIYRATFTGDGPDDFIVQHLKIQIASTTTIGTRTEHCVEFHMYSRQVICSLLKLISNHI